MEATNNLVYDLNNGQAIINPGFTQKNGVGTAGFVLAITGLLLCWVPILKWLLLLPAFLLSLIGSFRKPRTLAVIGTIISGLVILILMAIKISFISALISM